MKKRFTEAQIVGFLREADAGIPVEAWQQVVADAAVGRTLVGVAGTHGKSTTSGWLVHVLAAAGADPSAFVGALLPSSITSHSTVSKPTTARGRSASVNGSVCSSS